MLALKLLLLLIATNGAPVLGRRLFHERWNTPVDFGWTLPDGKPLFGPSKTWRGLLLGTLAGFGAGLLLQLPARATLVFAIAALLGDLLSSFCKRRLNKPASSRAPLLDQVPESLLPLLIGMHYLSYSLNTALLVCAVFVLLHIGLSPMLHRLGIRRQPH